MKLIVMLISLSVHYGPAAISGFDILEGCAQRNLSSSPFTRRRQPAW
jgi:hypothetical protein